MRFRVPALLFLLVVVFATVAWWCGPRAFPLANVEFSLTRSQAEASMKATVESMGHPLEGYMATSTFGEVDETKNYLELTSGIPHLEQASRDGVNIWYWVARWFKPGQHEEFSAWLDPQGRLVGYEETVKEEENIPTLDRDAALAVAEQFLARYVAHHPASSRKLVSESVEERPHRKDLTFNWEQEDLRQGEASYRLNVVVYGDRVGEFGEYLKIPEQWTRDYDQKRELNDLLGTIAGFGSSILMIGIVIFFIRGIMRHTIRWRHAMPWGWLLVFASVTLAASLNSLSGDLFSYETTQAWPAFLTEQTLAIILEVVMVSAGFWLLFVAADAVQRERQPGVAPLNHVLGAHALRDPQVVRAVGIGIITALGGYAYVSAFYVVGARFGVWAPVHVDNAQTLSGYLPWIEPMRIGLQAAFSEEFLFRLIAILLLWWVLRVRWLAIVIPAVVWAFLHSSYPQMPGYIRGVELTVEGIVWGILFLRFGIVSTLTAHYLYNCWLGSMIVIQSASWLDRTGAIVVASWPIAFYLWARWRNHRHSFQPEAALAPPPLPAEEPSPWSFSPVLLSRRQIFGCLFASAIFLAAIFLLPLAQVRIQALGVHDLSRGQILEKADAIMRAKGFDPSAYRHTISSSGGSLPSISYMLEHGSLDDLGRLFQSDWPDLTWNVRYFKFLEKEEFSVRLDQHGKLTRWTHRILKESPGADLDSDAALSLARETLTRDYGMDFSNTRLVTISPTKQEHRRDYYIVFERENLGWGAASLRTSISLQGDEPVSFSRWIKVPEAWSREQSKSGWRDVFTKEFRTWSTLALGVVVTVFLVFVIRRRVIPWKLAFLLALFPFSLSLLNTLNSLPLFFSGYTTTTPVLNYLITRGGGILAALAGGYLGSVFVVAISLGTARWGFGVQPKDIVFWPADPSERTRFLLSTAVIIFVSIVCFQFDAFAKDFFAGYILPTWVGHYGTYGISDAIPWLDALTRSLSTAFSSVFRLAFIAGLIALATRRFGRGVWIAVFLWPLTGALNADSWEQFLYEFVAAEVRLALIIFLVTYLWRFNVAAIFLAYFGSTFIDWLWLIWTKGGPAYRWDILPLLAIPTLALAAILTAHTLSRPRPPR